MSPAAVQGFTLLVSLALNIYVALDVRATPASVFQAAGRHRPRWMLMSHAGAFLLVFGIATACYYLLRVRPQLRREARSQGVLAQMTARVTVLRYLLPALALALAVVIAARS
jgi:hypothetical protein